MALRDYWHDTMYCIGSVSKVGTEIASPSILSYKVRRGRMEERF